MGLFKEMYKGYYNIKLKEKTDIDSVYELIKDGNYPLEKPEITGSGMMRAIRFPAIDKYQIAVAVGGKSVSVNKSYSGAGGLAKEIGGDLLTNGMYTGLNKENLDVNKLIEQIGQEVERIFREKGMTAK